MERAYLPHSAGVRRHQHLNPPPLPPRAAHLPLSVLFTRWRGRGAIPICAVCVDVASRASFGPCGVDAGKLVVFRCYRARVASAVTRYVRSCSFLRACASTSYTRSSCSRTSSGKGRLWRGKELPEGGTVRAWSRGLVPSALAVCPQTVNCQIARF